MEIQGDSLIISLSLIPQVPLVLLILCSILPWLLATKKWRKYYSRCDDLSTQVQMLQGQIKKQYSEDKAVDEKLAEKELEISALKESLQRKKTDTFCYRVFRPMGAPDIKIGEVKELIIVASSKEEALKELMKLDDLANDDWYSIEQIDKYGIVHTYYQ